MTSYAKDPRCIAMADALAPLLPEERRGYGGTYQVNLHDDEAVKLGGIDLIRAAMRKAARHLGWKAETTGLTGTRYGTVITVSDRRQVSTPFKAVVVDAMNARMRTALHKIWGEPGSAPASRDSPALMTQEFRAALAQGGPRQGG